jgi:hypothetical protein
LPFGKIEDLLKIIVLRDVTPHSFEISADVSEKTYRLHTKARRNTVRSENRCALRLRYVDLVVSIEVTVEVCC